MPSVIRTVFLGAVVACSVAVAMSSAAQRTPGENEIDRLMQRVLDNRYTSWRQLGDFTLRHVLTVDLEAPLENVSLTQLRREYEWYVSDGVAVRSPVHADGIDIDADARRDAEDDWRNRQPEDGDPQELAPGFISDTFYGTEFPFEPGAYYLAGRETAAGHEVPRIEYYPTAQDDEPSNPRLSQGFNKTSTVTFLIDPDTEQIAQYSLDNVGMDFLRLRWLARVEGFAVSAEMTPVGGVWMPMSTTLTARATTALGEFQVTIASEFLDYREAETGARLIDSWNAR